MLMCVSASHQTATFDLLERLSTPSSDSWATLASRHSDTSGAVVLATCNRFEVYLDTTGTAEQALAHVTSTASRIAGIDAETLQQSVVTYTGARVAEHLFAVASGLESVVVGESEISGQVRRALADARDRGLTTGGLERLFQRATEAQRGVKNATAIGRAGRSLVRLGLQLADSRIEDWTRTSVLMIGTGSYAATTLAALRELGVGDVAAHSPSGRQAAFAAKHSIRAVAGDALRREVAAADVIITCTSHAEPVITPESFELSETETMVIDLGMPRNVRPDVAATRGVTLLDLETIGLHAPLEELQAADEARSLVHDAATRFDAADREREAQAAIVALRSHVFALTEQEVLRARGRGESDVVEQAMRHLVGVLLHAPTTRARALAAEGRADEVYHALETLFGLAARPAQNACPYLAQHAS